MVDTVEYSQTPTSQSSQWPVIHFHTVSVNGVDIFYREAGPADGPVVLLPHGFPTSSRMFRYLMLTLGDRYRVIAPDYPGFGHSASPDRADFDYTFANYANLLHALIDALGVDRYALYCFDYGAPVGYRLALKTPERVSALLVQNGNAYEEGLQGFWDPMKVYWSADTPENREALGFIVEEEAVAAQYTHGVRDLTRIDPDNWTHDLAQLGRPGNREIQLDLFHDYGTNVPLYPQFQAFFREQQPPTLVVWGQNDEVFPAEGAWPYLRDLPDAEFHLLDTGHFVLEDQFDVVAPLIRDFLDRKLVSS
jgi:pimeloyl-ACP methyl ester carboxylesterase